MVTMLVKVSTDKYSKCLVIISFHFSISKDLTKGKRECLEESQCFLNSGNRTAVDSNNTIMTYKQFHFTDLMLAHYEDFSQ